MLHWPDSMSDLPEFKNIFTAMMGHLWTIDYLQLTHHYCEPESYLGRKWRLWTNLRAPISLWHDWQETNFNWEHLDANFSFCFDKTLKEKQVHSNLPNNGMLNWNAVTFCSTAKRKQQLPKKRRKQLKF